MSLLRTVISTIVMIGTAKATNEGIEAGKKKYKGWKEKRGTHKDDPAGSLEQVSDAQS
jgi:hypothetical protein